MIDNFNPTVIINEAPSTYNDNIRYTDSGYFLGVIDSRKVNSDSPVEVKRSDTKRGYRMSEDSEVADIYIEVIPTADGSKEIAWYYLDDDPCVIQNPEHFFTPYDINTMELDGFQISGTDEYPLAHVVDSFDNTASGNVLDMRGMTFGNTETYKLDFSDFNGTIYMPSTTAKISELKFESVDGSVIGLANLHTTVSCECSFLNAQITSLNISGIDLTNFSEFNIDSIDNVNMSNATFGTDIPSSFRIDNDTWNVTGLDFSSLSNNTLEGIMYCSSSSGDRQYFNLSGWKIPNNPLGYDGSLKSLIYTGYFPHINVSNWDLTQVTNISGLFRPGYDVGFNSKISGLDTWDVSNITDMTSLFEDNNLPDLSEISVWDISNVEHFDHMFKGTRNYVDDEGHLVEINDYSELNEWRDLLPITATYNYMLGNCNTEMVCPEWNGWFDKEGTFTPYDGSYSVNEVTFKGLRDELPSQGQYGDAYSIDSTGYYTDYYFWNTNNEWTRYQPN